MGFGTEINFKSEFVIAVSYKGIDLDCGFQCDFIIEDSIVLEIRSITEFHDIHKAQVLNYMNFISITVVLTFLSMSGIPPLVGFVGKFLIFNFLFLMKKYVFIFIFSLLNFFAIFFIYKICDS